MKAVTFVNCGKETFFTWMSLPCKHIFNVCEVVNFPAFDEALGHKRWILVFYLTTNCLSLDIPPLHDQDVDHCVLNLAENKSNLTQSQTFKRALNTA